MKKFAASFLLIITLAGCEDNSAAITNPPVSFATKTGFDTKRLRQFEVGKVRTYVEIDGEKAEVSNAKCVAESKEFKAEFVTPAEVRWPNVKTRPSLMKIQCRTRELAGSTTITPRLNEVKGVTSTGNLIADLVVIAGAAAIRAGAQVYEYRDTNTTLPIILEQGHSSKAIKVLNFHVKGDSS